MKICQLCAVDFTLLKFLLPLIDRQMAAGHEVIAVCSDGASIKNLRKNGYNIKTLSIERSINPIKFISSVWHLFKFLRQEKFDLIHVHTPVAALIGRVAGKLAKVHGIIYTAHGFYFHDEMSKLKKLFHIKLEKFAGYFTDLLFTQSTEDALTALRLNIVPSNRIFSIGNGVNVQKFNPKNIHSRTKVRNNFKIPQKAFVIGMVSRLVEEKGIIEFLEAAELIASKHKNVWFLLVGERLKSDHANLVNSRINKSKIVLDNRLVLAGMRDDIPQVLSAIDLFTLPSWREGMPRTIIEAMMMSIPVVATNIRGSREEIINEKTGLLVPTKDPINLAKALERILKNPNLAKKMGLAGRQRALKLYDESKVIDLQISLINKFFS